MTERNCDAVVVGGGNAALCAAISAAEPVAVVEVGPGTEPWTTYNTVRGPLAGSNLKSDTGFTPKYPLQQGVSAFADWLRNRPEPLE